MLIAAFTDIEEMSSQALEPPLSAYRRGKIEKLQNPLTIRQGIAAERLLERLLYRTVPSFTKPVELFADENGKPQLSDYPYLHMNLSHSGHYAACALSDHPVGIDVQVITAFREPLVRRCFTPAEREMLSKSQEPDRAFTLLWALKESYIKLSGQGLRIPMNSFSVEMTRENGLAVCHDAVFRFAMLEDAALAVCVPKGSDPGQLRFERIPL